MRYKLILEYDGTRYSGWQVQKNARSVQGTLLETARQFFGPDADVQGAGRTDAGVHALGQVAHLECTRKLDPQKILFGFNDNLPANINVLSVEAAHPRFHARLNAKSRSYVYIISRRRTAFAKRYVWWIRDPLELRKMGQACAVFRGFHDYAAFADKRIDKGTSTTVQVDAVELHEIGDLIIFRVAASHFLWRMVRRMVGILVEVGRGNLIREDVEELLSGGPSELPARCTAPPSGLFLEQVLYEGDKLNRGLPRFPLLLNR